MQSFAEAIEGRLNQERRSLDQALAEGDVFDQDVHGAALDDLYRLAFQNGVTLRDTNSDRPLLAPL